MKWLLLMLSATLGVVWTAFPQPAPAPSEAERKAAAPPVPLPSARTPVDALRELLAMSSTQREQALSNRSAQSRKFLEGKLKEFDSLPVAERESSLQRLQLRWHLLPLMKIPAGQREGRLATLTKADRSLVEDRLRQWDQLPEDLQRKVLENESFLRVFFRSQTNAPAMDLIATNLSPEQQRQMEEDRARWEAMTEGERQRVSESFDRIFKLPPKETSRILEGMGEKERRQMQKTLEGFSRLSKPQRDACLRGFQKFNDLALEERQEFLSNAERWQTMSATDRQIWRDLVARLKPSPPLPPGFKPKMPPLPPGAAPAPPLPGPTTRALTTN